MRKEELQSIKSNGFREFIDKESNNPNYELTVYESKTIPRPIAITEYPQYLYEWYNTHQPNKKHKNKPLFPSSWNNDEKFGKTYINSLLERLVKKSEIINRHISPHDFRHTAISRDRLNGMSTSSIETKYGWIHGTTQITIYDEWVNKVLCF